MESIQSKKSVARLLRQLIFVPILQNRWLNKNAKQRLCERIQAAEKGHVGEIYLIVENHLPIACAYRQDCRERAVALFAERRVWDTEDNSGVLIYVNVCERDLQIVADRGIDKKTGHDRWQDLWQNAALRLKKDELCALLWLIDEIGALLRLHYPSDTDRDELDNRPLYLR